MAAPGSPRARADHPGHTIRLATAADVPAIVRLLADDDLGATRERVDFPLDDAYLEAFRAIQADPAHELIVAVDGETLVGTLQLSILPYLTYRGGRRAQIEAVRVAKDRRGQRIGERLVRWAINRAKERGCHVIQLTTDKRRGTVVAFYERLGFATTHEGMKLHLVP